MRVEGLDVGFIHGLRGERVFQGGLHVIHNARLFAVRVNRGLRLRDLRCDPVHHRLRVVHGVDHRSRLGDFFLQVAHPAHGLRLGVLRVFHRGRQGVDAVYVPVRFVGFVRRGRDGVDDLLGVIHGLRCGSRRVLRRGELRVEDGEVV